MIRMVPTLSQIKAQVSLIRRKIPDASRIALQVSGQWLGDRIYEDHSLTYWIEQCHSPLALRIALRENLPPNTVKVILTDLESSQLSDDILLRLTKRRIFSLDAWQMVLSLFQAQSLDPRLRRITWLADYLIEMAPSNGYTAVVSGFLSAETVWSLVLGQILNLNSDRPDLLTLLHWSLDPQHLTSYQTLSSEKQVTIDQWLTENGGQTVAYLLKVFQSAKPEDGLALGLVLPVLYHPQSSNAWDKAIGKLEERYFQGNSPNSGIVNQWHQATVELLSSRLIDNPKQIRLVQRADEIFEEIGTQEATYWSRWSLSGFEERLKEFAKTLQSLFERPSPSQLQQQIEQFAFLKSHHQAQSPHAIHRWQRLEMTLRLAQWWVTTDPLSQNLPPSLSMAIAQELKEGCFLDWSRLKLRMGDPLKELERTYYFILDKVTQIREKQARHFALLYQRSLSLNHFDDSILLIEQVLEKVIVPLAQESPILIIILDGMSLAIARELLNHLLTTQQWRLCHPKPEQTGMFSALVPLPSITEVCRASLLCGQLQKGKSGLEKAQFSSHSLLLPFCRAKHPPRLFHKDALNKVDDHNLAEEVRSQIASKDNQIIAVVLNAIDDTLSKTDQIDIHWTGEIIKPLLTLLHEASLSQRQVILTSDHGHIVEVNTQYKSSDNGERWRIDDQQPGEGELSVTGSRTLMPESQTLIAPWTEKIRYSIKKQGYHGGLNPQEVLAPIIVLSPQSKTNLPWQTTHQDYYPDWWLIS